MCSILDLKMALKSCYIQARPSTVEIIVNINEDSNVSKFEASQTFLPRH
jgi:hypothetical protein